MNTAPTIQKMKGKQIASLTAYDFFTAKYIDSAGIDFILVGDSINMVIYGQKTTLSATMEVMLAHTKAVSLGVSNALVVGDLPFMSYQPSLEDAIRNAGKLILAGAGAVKLEGGDEVAHIAKKLVQSGIPCMGHIGMQPQSVHRFGGYITAGKTPESRESLLQSAKALEQTGCFAIVLEKVEREVASQITKEIGIPTIGIGSGPDCDGQILVVNDILGLYDTFTPPFVKKYANLKPVIIDAAKAFIADVKNGRYPK